MTGRDLIVYILENGLENEPVLKDGKFIGFVTASDVAMRLNVGVATVYAWICQQQIPAVFVDGMLYIPADFKLSIDERK